ncbi:MAG: hypothetical protein MZV63_14925 [Marinilabiliales bacterium]|nr:hypothetical protein [Marinilabiliales bacterium]
MGDGNGRTAGGDGRAVDGGDLGRRSIKAVGGGAVAARDRVEAEGGIFGRRQTVIGDVRHRADGDVDDLGAGEALGIGDGDGEAVVAVPVFIRRVGPDAGRGVERRRAVGWQRRHTERTGRQAVGVGHHQRAGDLGVFCSTAAVAAGDDARAVIDRGDGDGDGGRFGHAAAGDGAGVLCPSYQVNLSNT